MVDILIEDYETSIEQIYNKILKEIRGSFSNNFDESKFHVVSLKEKSNNSILNTSSQSTWSSWNEIEVSNHPGWAFIDFTAEWCLTCKVNKKLVMDTDEFLNFSTENKIKLFRADWTDRNESISNFLSKNNIFGIPAYFLKTPKGELLFLGETISIGKIKKKMAN